MRVEVTKEVEPIEISDDESESDDVQIIDNCEEAAPSGPAATAAPGESDDPELEAALAGLDADTEKQVHNVIQELNKHVEADMWKLAYEEANEENKKLSLSMLSLLECPVCLTVITKSPVPCCTNGHTLCSTCWTRSHTCPCCRADLHKAARCYSQTANGLLQILTNLPCSNQHLGCSFSSSVDSVETHQTTCPYNTHQNSEAEVRCQQSHCKVGRETEIPRGVKKNCNLCGKSFSRKYFKRHSCLEGTQYYMVRQLS